MQKLWLVATLGLHDSIEQEGSKPHHLDENISNIQSLLIDLGLVPVGKVVHS